jgi:hypothetical protein
MNPVPTSFSHQATKEPGGPQIFAFARLIGAKITGGGTRGFGMAASKGPMQKPSPTKCD